MFGFAPLTSVPLSSLPVTGAQAATGFVSGSFGTPLAGYARTQTATGATPSTTFGAAKFGTTVAATGIAPNTKLGAPPKFGPNILQIVGNGANGETTFVDESPYYAALTRNGSIAKSTAQSRFGTGSISLTGASTANSITSPSDKRFNLVGDLFSIETEVYLNAYNASGGRLLSSGSGANGWNVTNGFQWLLQSNGSGVEFQWLWYGLSGVWGYYTQTLSAVLSLSTWAQMKVTFDGTTVRLFLDGALVGSSAKPPTVYGGSSTVAAAVAVGALVGEATGATNAANAYIQQIRIRTDCTDTVAFSAPTAGLPSWIGELAGIAPTTQVPTPTNGLGQPATGFTSTLFGTGFGQNLQRPTGFQSTAVGDPRIFPYSPPPINSTQFGTGRLFPYHVAPGINGTQFGALAGWQHWDVEWAPPKTRFGTPFITFNQTQIASGFTRGNFGTPLGMRVLPPNTGRICIAQPVPTGHIGTPRLAFLQVGTATGIQGGSFGAATASVTSFASSVSSVLIGTPTSSMATHAQGFRPGNIGAPSALMTQQATSLYLAPRWGQAESDRSNTYKAVGIYVGSRIGQPTGAQRVNRTASGFTGGGLGSPTCRQRHLVTSMAPSCRIGAPLLRRNMICGIEGRAAGLTGSRFGSPRLHGLHGVTGTTSGAFGVPTA